MFSSTAGVGVLQSRFLTHSNTRMSIDIYHATAFPILSNEDLSTGLSSWHYLTKSYHGAKPHYHESWAP